MAGARLTESERINVVQQKVNELQDLVDDRVAAFALPGDEMFRNTIVGFAAREKEIKVAMVSGMESIGFVTGLDAEFLQLVTTKDQGLLLVNIANIEDVAETGRTISSIESIKGLDDDQVVKALDGIKRHYQTMWIKAKDVMRAKSALRDAERELDRISS